MRFVKLILILSVCGMVWHYWQGQKPGVLSGPHSVSESGFVDLPKPDNFEDGSVIILAAKNCTKEAAQRADRLASELGQLDIPSVRAQHISFNNIDPSTKKQLDSVMKGTLPIVLINGKGKPNPTLDEVVSEYNSIYE